MDELSGRERDLVALGAALGSNCVPCAEHYVSRARGTGVTDQQIEDAIRLADGVRRVPAQKVLDAALGMLSKTIGAEAGAAEAERTGSSQGARAQDGTPDGAGPASPACADRKPCCG